MNDKNITHQSVNIGLQGIWWDEFYKHDGYGIEYCAGRTEKKHNRIMDKMAKLIAGFFFNEPSWNGIWYHALGTGQVSWDGSIPPVPPATNEILDNEYYRRQPDVPLEYIDDVGGVFTPTGTPGDTVPPGYVISSRVRLKTTFDYGDANGEWIREQAIFGGDASGTLNTGHIFNIIRHNKIEKTAGIKLIRFIQFNITINS